MKKTIKILLLLVSLFVNLSIAQTEEFKAKAEKARTFKVENGVGIVIIGYDDSDAGYSGFDFFGTTKKFDVPIKAVILNASKKVINTNPLYFKAVTKLGYTLSIEDFTFKTTNPFTAVDLEPDTKTEGFLIFGLNSSKDEVVTIVYDDNLGHRVSRDYEDAKTMKMVNIFEKYK